MTRPEAGKGDAEVTLTATLSSGNVTDTKVFKVTVKQNLTAKEIVKGDTEALCRLADFLLRRSDTSDRRRIEIDDHMEEF